MSSKIRAKTRKHAKRTNQEERRDRIWKVVLLERYVSFGVARAALPASRWFRGGTTRGGA